MKGKDYIQNIGFEDAYQLCDYEEFKEYVGRMFDEFHLQKVKENELLHSVSQQRELLKAFTDFLETKGNFDKGASYLIEPFLKSL